jgi:hypothetical protein
MFRVTPLYVITPSSKQVATIKFNLNNMRRFLAAVRDNFCINQTIALEDSEDFDITRCSASALALN